MLRRRLEIDFGPTGGLTHPNVAPLPGAEPYFRYTVGRYKLVIRILTRQDLAANSVDAPFGFLVVTVADVDQLLDEALRMIGR
jgi:hypothetical protein